MPKPITRFLSDETATAGIDSALVMSLSAVMLTLVLSLLGIDQEQRGGFAGTSGILVRALCQTETARDCGG